MSDPRPSLPPSSLALLVEVITGGPGNTNVPPIGIYRSATMLSRLFALCEVEWSVGSMQSRTDAVLTQLRAMNGDPAQEAATMRLAELLADLRQCDQDPQKQQAVVAALNSALAPVGREVVLLADGPKVLPRGTTAPVAAALQAKAEALNLDTVQRDLRRALDQAESDPEDALTSACSLLESVCRTILDRLGKGMPRERNLRPLADATRDALGLGTARAGLPVLIAQDVNQVLTGLTTTINGVASLRTHAGDAHGREAGHPRVDPRIARLGVNAAGTLALFLVETWQRRSASAGSA